MDIHIQDLVLGWETNIKALKLDSHLSLSSKVSQYSAMGVVFTLVITANHSNFAPFPSESTNFWLLSWMVQGSQKSSFTGKLFCMPSFQIIQNTQLDEFLNEFQAH